MNVLHKTIPIQIWADIDEGIADIVRYLNTLPGVRTHASCQGTIGEGGPVPYRSHVVASWSEDALDQLVLKFDIVHHGENWGYLYPRESSK